VDAYPTKEDYSPSKINQCRDLKDYTMYKTRETNIKKSPYLRSMKKQQLNKENRNYKRLFNVDQIKEPRRDYIADTVDEGDYRNTRMTPNETIE
jgi:hypothetical protein